MDYGAAFATLARSWAAYSSRPEQIELASGIAAALRQQSTFIAEAGTGIGKTLAYLLPSLLENKRVIISTANKNLQEQLVLKDVPALQKALGRKCSTALLKGRNSYFCWQGHHQFQQEWALSTQDKRHLARVERFLQRSRDGDLAALRGVPETAPIMAHLRCSSEDCLRSRCPFFERCFVYRAREAAQEAQIVVLNHHLLGVYAKLTRLGLPTPLDGRDAIIVDEAHQLEEALRESFGVACSLRRLHLYYAFCQQHLSALQAPHHLPALDLILERLRLLSLEDCGQEALLQEHGLWQALEDWRVRLRNWLEQEKAAPSDENDEQERQRSRLLWTQRSQTLLEDVSHLCQLARQPQQQDEALWLQREKQNWTIYSLPVDVGLNSAALWQRQASIFLSATLHIEHFARRLGLNEAQQGRWPSPFDYRRQALLYHVRGLPEPKHPDYGRACMAALRPVVALSRGRALLLFTSHRAMREAADFWRQQAGFKILVQGEDSKNELLKRFRSEDQAVLLATQSFWEGVDIRGRALVCVFIDRLPFPVPDHPVKMLRQKRLGGAYFREEYLPQMLTQLKQGAGRLIRSAEDYGVLVLCDPRLNHPRYGAQALAAIPRMSRCDDLAVVKRFFAYHEQGEPS